MKLNRAVKNRLLDADTSAEAPGLVVPRRTQPKPDLKTEVIGLQTFFKLTLNVKQDQDGRVEDRRSVER